MSEIISFVDISPVAFPGNDAILLNSSNSVAQINSGSVDLFLVPVDKESNTGKRFFISRLNPGDILFFLDDGLVPEGFEVLAVGTSNTTLSFVPRDRFLSEATPAQIVTAIESWFQAGYSTLTDAHPSPASELVSSNTNRDLSAGTTIHSHDDTCWIPSGDYTLLSGFLDMQIEFDVPFPLVKGIWLTVSEAHEFSPEDRESIASPSGFVHLFNTLTTQLLEMLLMYRQQQESEGKTLQQQRISNDQSRKNDSLDLLARVYSEHVTEIEDFSGDSNTLAFHAVCQLIKIQVTQVKVARANAQDHIQQIARASNVPLRRVLLRGRWWVQESEPMIGFLEGENRAVALLPKKNEYVCFDPVTMQSRPVDEKLVQQLDGNAFMPYRSLPSGQVSGKDLFRFSLFNSKFDLLRIFLFGSFGGLLAMAVPLATGVLFDQIIPASNRAQLFQITFAIALVAMATGVFQYIQGLSVLRLESRAGHALQCAVWDRIVRLPVNFFSNYSTGDLVQRAFGVDQIRQQVSSTVVRTILSFIFSIFSIGLLFYYSVHLALWACLLVGIAVLFTICTGLLSVPATREQQNIEGKLTAFVLQCIEGVSKIRVTSSEDRAFSKWAEPFAEKCNSIKTTQKLQAIDNVFSSIFPLLCSMAIFYLIIHNNNSINLSTGSFLAFNAAFINVLTSFLMISASLVMMFRLIPVYQRMKPIMMQSTESDFATVDPGELKGEIEISNLHFRYTQGGQSILNGVELHISPGEFVALVGTSGSGKSTLFRILLGFETPELGSIAFDKKDISTLDKQELRRQVGVVLQSGKLMPGDIFTNIIGSSNLTLEQAWEAARMAGFEDDIKSMPMGMHTVLSEGGGGLSGGQKQRLQIARAFVHKPRILFFDEATSALDNRTQEIVTKSMNELHATRIVVAHRLSTVIDADKILVMNKGVIEEAGNYEELMEKKGLFYTMASRQIA